MEKGVIDWQIQMEKGVNEDICAFDTNHKESVGMSQHFP